MLNSGMTDFEYVKIVATWYYSVEERFNCETQKDKLYKYSDFEKRIEQLESRNGCNKHSENSGFVESFTSKPIFVCDDIGYYQCFCNFVDPSSLFILRLFFQYEKGFLPFSGSIVDQPPKIMELFSILTYLKSEKQKELDEKMKAKEKRK